MIRLAVFFSIALVLAVITMAGIALQYGYTLIDPEMRMIWLGIILLAAYVAWRVDGIIKKREQSVAEYGEAAKTQSLLGTLFGPKKTRGQLAREARVRERKEKLIREGKLVEEPTPAKDEPALRVSGDADLKDRMAARRARVEKAQKEGKL